MSKPQKIYAARDHAMYGAIELGLWGAAYFILQAQQLNHAWVGILAVFVQVYMIFCAYQLGQHYKVTECDGVLSYGGAFKYLIWLGFFASIIVAPVVFVYLKWVDSSYLSAMYSLSVEQVQTIYSGVSEEVKASSIETLRYLYTPIRYTFLSIASHMLSAFFWALLLALPISRRTSRFSDLFKQDKEDEERDNNSDER